MKVTPTITISSVNACPHVCRTTAFDEVRELLDERPCADKDNEPEREPAEDAAIHKQIPPCSPTDPTRACKHQRSKHKPPDPYIPEHGVAPQLFRKQLVA